LKNKLAVEGLFHQLRKKQIPKMPKSVGIITSTSGAAVRDILATLARRFPLALIFIYPSEVQGATAPQQLINALRLANAEKRCDVLILARGGGSIEDLWAFNDEQLARQIAISSIPVISGVGHETDFTIADFVADYRAETPTAAAAAATPDSIELFNLIRLIVVRLHTAITVHMQHQNLKLKHLADKVASPQLMIASYWQTLDYLERQLRFNLSHQLNIKKHQLQLCFNQLHAKNPQTQLSHTQNTLKQIITELISQIKIRLNTLKHQLNCNLSTLHAVSPLATLDRGYAIAMSKSKVLLTTQQVHVGDTIEIRLANGTLACDVIHIKD